MCDIFTTCNSLKSQEVGKLLLPNRKTHAKTPKLWSRSSLNALGTNALGTNALGMNGLGMNGLGMTFTSDHKPHPNPHSDCGTHTRIPHRGSLPWRLSDDGPCRKWKRRHGAVIRNPSHTSSETLHTTQQADSCTAANGPLILSLITDLLPSVTPLAPIKLTTFSQ